MPEDDIDYGTGEGAAYGGSDPDAPLFLPHSTDNNSSPNHQYKSTGTKTQYALHVLKGTWRIIAKVGSFVFSNAAAWSAVASVVMAVSTVIYTVYAHRQWKVMSGQ